MIPVPVFPGAHLAFDALAWGGGALFGLGLRRSWLAETARRVSPGLGPGYYLALAVGAVAGAWLAGSLNTLAQDRPVLSHSVAGALVGAIAAVETYKAVKGLRGSTGVLWVGPFALGIVIGRWGCLLTGLKDNTFGTPTRLPWGVDLGDHVARHPVQVYESLAVAGFLVLWLVALRRGSDWALRRSFYVFCLWYGVQRFAWEFLKPYPRLIGPLNLFHGLTLGLIAYGWICYRADLARQQREEGRALSVPGPDHQPV